VPNVGSNVSFMGMMVSVMSAGMTAQIRSLGALAKQVKGMKSVNPYAVNQDTQK
jgi:hypothetical protein